jgi:hypothetical protein
VLEIKTVVVHFQDKAFNAEWKTTGNLLAESLVDVTKLTHLKSHKQDFGEGQLTRELKLGGVNQDEMRKWVKTMYVLESTYHGETSPIQRNKGRWR